MSARLILSSPILLMLVVVSTANDELENIIPSYAEFMKQYSVNSSSVDYLSGASNYAENIALIISTNKKNLPYKLGVNRFADQPLDKFQGLPSPAAAPAAARSFRATLKGHRRLIANLPARMDWREHGYVSPVKNQGACNSGWAFSAIGALEGAYLRTYKRLLKFSEQQLLDCSGDFGNAGCIGGNPPLAYQYLESKGAMLERDYPYLGRGGKCGNHTEIVKIRRIIRLAYDENLVKHVVGTLGPVSVAFRLSPTFYFYESGIFSAQSCLGGYHHALIVGYGTENGVAYWTVKNSWGESWGNRGYFKIKRGQNMCGIASSPFYPYI